MKYFIYLSHSLCGYLIWLKVRVAFEYTGTVHLMLHVATVRGSQKSKASDLSKVWGSQNYNTLPLLTKQSPAAAALVVRCQHHCSRLD